jgi:hypothetical protein
MNPVIWLVEMVDANIPIERNESEQRIMDRKLPAIWPVSGDDKK